MYSTCFYQIEGGLKIILIFFVKKRQISCKLHIAESYGSCRVSLGFMAEIKNGKRRKEL